MNSPCSRSPAVVSLLIYVSPNQARLSQLWSRICVTVTWLNVEHARARLSSIFSPLESTVGASSPEVAQPRGSSESIALSEIRARGDMSNREQHLERLLPRSTVERKVAPSRARSREKGLCVELARAKSGSGSRNMVLRRARSREKCVRTYPARVKSRSESCARKRNVVLSSARSGEKWLRGERALSKRKLRIAS